jgi:hypothetical protein
MKTIKLIYLRWKSETPKFFNKLKNIALGIGGMSLAALTAIEIVNKINAIDFHKLPTILGYIIVTCAFIAGTSKLTTTDTNLSNGKS